MSVLIKGIYVKEIKRGAVACLNIDDVVFFVNSDKIIPAPDHGNLIDRDALNATDSWEWIRHDAPVVIPAERSEE